MFHEGFSNGQNMSQYDDMRGQCMPDHDQWQNPSRKTLFKRLEDLHEYKLRLKGKLTEMIQHVDSMINHLETETQRVDNEWSIIEEKLQEVNAHTFGGNVQRNKEESQMNANTSRCQNPKNDEFDLRTNMRSGSQNFREAYNNLGLDNDNIPIRSREPCFESQMNKNEINEMTRISIIDKMKRKPTEMYAGKPEEFDSWYNIMLNKIEGIQANSLDAMEILKAHCIGTPKRLIHNIMYRNNMTADDKLIEIKTKLSKRFGSKVLVAKSLSEKLYQFPKIEAPIETPQLGRILRKFSDLCETALHAGQDNNYLGVTFNCDSYAEDPTGFQRLEQKLPEQQLDQWKRIKYQLVNDHEEKQTRDLPPLLKNFCKYIKQESDSLCTNFLRSKTYSQKEADRLCNNMGSFKTHIHTENRWQVKKPRTTKVNIKETSRPEDLNCVVHESKYHSTESCKKYRSLSAIDQWFLRRKYNLCEYCLVTNDKCLC